MTFPNISRRKYVALAAAVGMTLAALVPLSGCGGSGGPQSPPAVPRDQVFVTRATEGTFSADAKILAMRVTPGTFLLADDAARFDSDLQRIRAQSPQVADIHARPDFTLTQLLVAVRPDAPWLARWQAGDLTTGEAAIDDLLRQYGATGVQPLGSPTATQFALTFGQSMNMRAVADVFRSAGSPNLVGVSTNNIVGDGDRITFQPGADGARVYALSRGWGDCFAGCIGRHTWEFTLSADGQAVTLRESGPPVPMTAAP
jgi:hypothetical protein